MTSIVGTLERQLRIEVDASLIDPNSTYCFEIEDGGRIFRWTGAKALIEGDRALFDYGNGRNGLLIAGAPSTMRMQ